MLNVLKSLFRRKEARKFGSETAYGWAEALRYDFIHHDYPANELRQLLADLAPGVALPILISTHGDDDIRILGIVLAAVDSRADCHVGLMAALNDRLEVVRRSAAIALVKMNRVSGLAAVVAGDRHGHGIRTQAAYRLAEHGPAAADAIPALYALINCRDINWRSHAAASKALAAIGDSAIPFLHHAMQLGSPESKYHSAWAVRELGGPNELRRLADEILRSSNLGP